MSELVSFILNVLFDHRFKVVHSKGTLSQNPSVSFDGLRVGLVYLNNSRGLVHVKGKGHYGR
eukprot:10151762-Heterocapsa_arctica.AAC.1